MYMRTITFQRKIMSHELNYVHFTNKGKIIKTFVTKKPLKNTLVSTLIVFPTVSLQTSNYQKQILHQN